MQIRQGHAGRFGQFGGQFAGQLVVQRQVAALLKDSGQARPEHEDATAHVHQIGDEAKVVGVEGLTGLGAACHLAVQSRGRGQGKAAGK